MPELPEVETMRRGILGAVGGCIEGIWKPKTDYRPLAMTPEWSVLKKKLLHQRIVDVRRLGKRVLVDLEMGSSLIFQPKMSGLLLVGPPPTPQHVRMKIQLTGGKIPEITYWDSRGLGSIHLWDEVEIEAHLGRAVLGPDAVEVTLKEFKNRFQDCKREIKPTLLDQKRLAGVGNLYASEILHMARVHPQQRCCDLTDEQWKRTYHAMRKILLAAIEAEGSTLGDGTYRNSLNDPGSYQSHHRVYDRANEPCLKCHSHTIIRIVQTQRSTFYCERCQPLF